MKFFIHDSDGAKPDKYCQALAPNPKPQNPKTKKPKTKGPWADQGALVTPTRPPTHL